jgi:hypothetical protein
LNELQRQAQHLASGTLIPLNAQENKVHLCAILTTAGDWNSEKIPETNKKRRYISWTERDMSGIGIHGPGLCWKFRKAASLDQPAR